MSASLPYDATPPPSPPAPVAIEEDNPALDRPLDDYIPPTEAIPEHVQSLMGRMSKGKIYLMEESPGILFDADERTKRDPRIVALTHRLDKQDPTGWLEAISAGAPSPIKPQALYLRSDLIQHLSTAKVFSWASSLGANVMGIEWLNDTTLHLLFPTPAAALLGLTLLSKAGFDPAEGDDPLLERAAHSIPFSLLPLAEPEEVDSSQGQELLPSSTSTEADGVKRRGRGKFGAGSGSGSGLYDLEPLVPVEKEDAFKLAPGVDPHARLTLRYAIEADGELRRQAKQSEWYKRHGRNAGKETASSARSSNRNTDTNESNYSFSGRGSGSGEGRDFAKRIGRERKEPYARPRGRKTQDDLDRELENLAKRRTAGDDSMDLDMDMEQGSRRDNRSDRRGAGGRRQRGNKDDLDKELDDLFSARSAAA